MLNVQQIKSSFPVFAASPQTFRQISFCGRTPDCDCFVKSLNPKGENEFIKWAKENNFTADSLKESLCDENLIGSGFNNTVYAINGCDDFVLRTGNYAKGLQGVDFSDYSLNDTEDKSLKGNFGQEVALFKSSDIHKPPVQVLRKQNGITNCNPPPSAIYTEDGRLKAGKASYEALERKQHYSKCLDILASMPDEAYDELIKKFSIIDEAGYKFDYYNPNNFLLNTEEGRIELIDLDKAPKGTKNDLGNALWALLDIQYLNTYVSNTDESASYITDESKKKAVEDSVKIIDKYTRAMKNNGKKYSGDGYEFAVHLIGSLPMTLYLKEFSHTEQENALRNMGVME